MVLGWWEMLGRLGCPRVLFSAPQVQCTPVVLPHEVAEKEQAVIPWDLSELDMMVVVVFHELIHCYSLSLRFTVAVSHRLSRS